jgi:hypothetical protein
MHSLRPRCAFFWTRISTGDCVAIYWTIRWNPCHLSGALGRQYSDYMRRTKRLVPLFISVATPVRGVPVFRSWRDRRRTAPWLQSAPKATSFRRRHGCNYLPSPTLRRDKQPLSSWIVASFATYGSLRRAKSGLWWLGKKDLSIPRVDPR